MAGLASHVFSTMATLAANGNSFIFQLGWSQTFLESNS